MRADLVLTPGHAAYQHPRAGEQFFYRRGAIRFVGVSRLVWIDQGTAPARDASGELDFGNIDTFEWDDAGYRLEGDIGRIEVRAARVEAVLDGG